MPALAVKIPKEACGQLLSEDRIKAGLLKLSPGIFFDYASRHDKWHPYQDIRQGVYHDDREDGRKHICSMDRGVLDGMIPEVPIWKTDWDIVEVTWDEVSAGELISQEPPFPMPCYHDENKVQIRRQVKNDIILSGWRHTFDKLIATRTPGVTRSALEAEFGISMRDYVEPCLIPEEGAPVWEDNPNAPEEGSVWDELGMYEARPTVCLNGEGVNDDHATVVGGEDTAR